MCENLLKVALYGKILCCLAVVRIPSFTLLVCRYLAGGFTASWCDMQYGKRGKPSFLLASFII